MKFCIKDYIWNIFEIAAKNNTTDMRISLDMFTVNLELSHERYRGAKSIKYDQLSAVWNSMQNIDHKIQVKIYHRIIGKEYLRLRLAFTNGDKKRFNAIINQDPKDHYGIRYKTLYYNYYEPKKYKRKRKY